MALLSSSLGLNLTSIRNQRKCSISPKLSVTNMACQSRAVMPSKSSPATFLRTSRGARVLRRAFEKQSQGGTGAVMEKTRNFFVMPTPPSAPKLDDSGNGGNMGRNIHNGGGGGGGGDGDDDDYFQEGDDDGEGGRRGPAGRLVAAFALFRQLVPESYDELSIAAVLAEWMRTVADLPAILRHGLQMGLLSSAQLVRFVSMDVRPNAVRAVTRSLPPEVARGLVGRLMADPAFLHKLFFETALAGASAMLYEFRVRGDRFKEELDLAVTNAVGASAATFAAVWLVAPTRNYGFVNKYGWQQALDKLPNCVFDKGTPLLPYSLSARVAGFLAKAAELSAVGLMTGTATSLAGSAALALRANGARRIAARSRPGSKSATSEASSAYEPSVPVPDAAGSSAGLAAYYGLSANARYQLLGGLEQLLFGHSKHLAFYLGVSGLLRVANSQLGELHRPLFQGLPQLPAPSLQLEDLAARAADALAAVPDPRRALRSAVLDLTLPDLAALVGIPAAVAPPTTTASPPPSSSTGGSSGGRTKSARTKRSKKRSTAASRE